MDMASLLPAAPSYAKLVYRMSSACWPGASVSVEYVTLPPSSSRLDRVLKGAKAGSRLLSSYAEMGSQ